MRRPLLSSLVLVLSVTVSAATPRAKDITWSQRTVLNQDTNVRAKNFFLPRGAVIVTNGYALTIDASEEIELKKEATIVSFEPSAAPSYGNAGKAAGLVDLRAKRVDGGVLRIVNRGQDGAPGKPGEQGAPGTRGSQGEQRSFNPFGGCSGGTSGSPGGTGMTGGNGGNGGDGGRGGQVVLRLRSTANIDVDVSGGLGGDPGRGGIGGPGGEGGEAAPGTTFCGGTRPGPRGPQGTNGKDGASGRAGLPGQKIVLPN